MRMLSFTPVTDGKAASSFDHGHRLSVAVAQKDLLFKHLGNCIHALQKAQCLELLLRNLEVLSLDCLYFDVRIESIVKRTHEVLQSIESRQHHHKRHGAHTNTDHGNLLDDLHASRPSPGLQIASGNEAEYTHLMGFSPSPLISRSISSS